MRITNSTLTSREPDMTVNVAVIYYSATGTVHALAQAVAEGADSAGAEVRLRRVAELAPDGAIDQNPLWRRHVDAVATSVVRGLARGSGVGRRVRVRDADPLRRAMRTAQAVHRPGRRAVAGRHAGRQARDRVHLGVQPARRQRGHDLVAGQRLLPLGALIVPPGFTDPVVYAAAAATRTARRSYRADRARPDPTPRRWTRPGTRGGGWPRSRSGCWRAAASPMPPRATGTAAQPGPATISQTASAAG